MHIRRATARDAERIAEIYNSYVLNTIITFETDVVSPQEMTKRVQEKNIDHDWLVGEANQEVIGYAYYGPFRPRAAYHDTVESTIYLRKKAWAGDLAGLCTFNCWSQYGAADSAKSWESSRCQIHKVLPYIR